jgi:hypothetical protein
LPLPTDLNIEAMITGPTPGQDGANLMIMGLTVMQSQFPNPSTDIARKIAADLSFYNGYLRSLAGI